MVNGVLQNFIKT